MGRKRLDDDHADSPLELQDNAAIKAWQDAGYADGLDLAVVTEVFLASTLMSPGPSREHEHGRPYWLQ